MKSYMLELLTSGAVTDMVSYHYSDLARPIPKPALIDCIANCAWGGDATWQCWADGYCCLDRLVICVKLVKFKSDFFKGSTEKKKIILELFASPAAPNLSLNGRKKNPWSGLWVLWSPANWLPPHMPRLVHFTLSAYVELGFTLSSIKTKLFFDITSRNLSKIQNNWMFLSN